MRELDTISDFVAYLSKREALLASGRLALATGEEALLGWYLMDTDANDEHDFVFRDGEPVPVAVDERSWQRYASSSARERKVAANEVSFLWDHQIELFTKHFMEGTSDHLTEATHASQDQILRFFARENRTRRRMLAGALVDMVQKTIPDMRRIRVIEPSRRGDPYWVLVLVPWFHKMPADEYRAARRGYLTACMEVVKLLKPDALDIVGFATESGRGVAGSEDAIYYDARNWTEDDARRVQKLQHDLEILVRPTYFEGKELEYPPAVPATEQLVAE